MLDHRQPGTLTPGPLDRGQPPAYEPRPIPAVPEFCPVLAGAQPPHAGEEWPRQLCLGSRVKLPNFPGFQHLTDQWLLLPATPEWQDPDVVRLETRAPSGCGLPG